MESIDRSFGPNYVKGDTLMDGESRVYAIYRNRFRTKEDPIYGWTESKSAARMFLEERKKKKYTIMKSRYKELQKRFSEFEDQLDRYRLDLVRFKSAKDGKDYYLISTLNELKSYEMNCQDLFRYMSSTEKIDPNRIEYFLDLVANIQKEYASALNIIGFVPREFESLFPGEDSMEWVQHGIDSSYEDIDIREYHKRYEMPGRAATNEIYMRIIYSLESFIRVMKEDL